jgi:hypothetical protein
MVIFDFIIKIHAYIPEINLTPMALGAGCHAGVPVLLFYYRDEASGEGEDSKLQTPNSFIEK